jgi:hypothetical protein
MGDRVRTTMLYYHDKFYINLITFTFRQPTIDSPGTGEGKVPNLHVSVAKCSVGK